MYSQAHGQPLKLSLEVLDNAALRPALAKVNHKRLTATEELGNTGGIGMRGDMTMPKERTRTIIQPRGFLVSPSRGLALPEAVRDEAHRLLRHSPSADEVLLAEMVEEQPEPAASIKHAISRKPAIGFYEIL